LTAFITLYKALGGGWSTEEDVEEEVEEGGDREDTGVVEAGARTSGEAGTSLDEGDGA